MNSTSKSAFIFIVLIPILMIFKFSSFIVEEHQQAIITELGEVQAKPIIKAGLYWHLPFVQQVQFFDKRLQSWDGDNLVITSKDRQLVTVTTSARWYIADPRLFYQSVQNIPTALLRMTPLIEDAIKSTLKEHNLPEVVRSSNNIVKSPPGSHDPFEEAPDKGSSTDFPPIKVGQEKLKHLIAKRAYPELKSMGIKLIDVQIRRLAFQENVEKNILQNMLAENQQIAARMRADGRAEEAKILGQLNLSLKKIESEAYRKSEMIRGLAEAEATQIYAQSLRAEPEYFEFIKTLEVYKKTISEKGEFILSTDNAFLKLLQRGEDGGSPTQKISSPGKARAKSNG